MSSSTYLFKYSNFTKSSNHTHSIKKLVKNIAIEKVLMHVESIILCPYLYINYTLNKIKILVTFFIIIFIYISTIFNYEIIKNNYIK